MNRLLLSLFSVLIFTSPVFAVTDYLYCDYTETDNANANWYMRYLTRAQVSYPASVNQNSTASISIANLTLDCSRQGAAPQTCDSTANQLGGIGDAQFTIPASRSNPIVTLYGNPGDGGTVEYRASATHSFTTPSQPGTYTLTGLCSVFSEFRQEEYQYVVNATQPQCSDGIDNDGDGSTDAGDPQCNNNCVANSQYAPNHNSESTPPNGTCPAAPTLNLNGRAAFLQVVKNFVAFITTKAFAGE